ncbi:MAG TPA: MerR family transcriptional regulator [Tepidiformaceae bacterium]
MTEELERKKYLQIGEAAERAQRTQRTLRYYEEKGLLSPPERMEGGFRLYSPEDMERVERIKQLQELLGFSLAEIKEMLETEDVRLQIRAEWRHDADGAAKAAMTGRARDITLQQIGMIDQKMTKMADLRKELSERLQRYNERLLKWTAETEQATHGSTPSR